MRTGNIDRKTNETDIKLSVDLDGGGKALKNFGVHLPMMRE